jgi:hypothetical protein
MKIITVIFSITVFIETIFASGDSKPLELIWMEKDSLLIDLIFAQCLNMEVIDFCKDSFTLRTWTLYISDGNVDADGQKPSRIIRGKAIQRNDTLILFGDEKKSMLGLIIDSKKPKIDFLLKRLLNTSNNQEIWKDMKTNKIFLNKMYNKKPKRLY